jgi:hypothetical protein
MKKYTFIFGLGMLLVGMLTHNMALTCVGAGFSCGFGLSMSLDEIIDKKRTDVVPKDNRSPISPPGIERKEVVIREKTYGLITHRCHVNINLLAFGNHEEHLARIIEANEHDLGWALFEEIRKDVCIERRDEGHMIHLTGTLVGLRLKDEMP